MKFDKKKDQAGSKTGSKTSSKTGGKTSSKTGNKTKNNASYAKDKNAFSGDKLEKTVKTERPVKMERSERPARSERPDKPARAVKPGQTNRPARPINPNQVDKPMKSVKAARAEKPAKGREDQDIEADQQDVMMTNRFLEIEIVDIGDEGEGIGRSEGMTVFVEGGLPGDIVTCQIETQKKSYAKAKLKKIIKPSADRVVAPCSVYQSCGGCQIQDFDYKAQLKFKENMVLNALKRVGQFSDIEVKPIIGMKDSFRYRNKGLYPVQGSISQPIIGFYKKNSHNVVDVRDCLLQDEKNAIIIEMIRKYMRDFKVAPYDQKSHEGTLKSVMIRKSEKTGEIMVVLITSGRKLAMTKTLVNLLTNAVPGIVSIVQNVHASHSIKGLGEENKILFGKATITDEIADLKFEISPQSFYQVNAKQTEVIYKKAMDFAKLTGEETVYELYSGTGTISLFLAQKAKKVYGIENVEEAVLNARKNAELNNLTNVEFILGDAETEFEKLYEQGHRADVVVVDPPRSGCEANVIETILKMAPDRIVYVSCKPSTLARDMKLLCENDLYKVVEVQPVDVFGHTAHVEAIILMTRSGSGDK